MLPSIQDGCLPPAWEASVQRSALRGALGTKGIEVARVDVKCGPNKRASRTEQINRGITELAGHQAGDRAGKAIGDVEECYKSAHSASTIGRRHTLQRFHAKRGKDERAAEPRDQCSRERDAFIRSAPHYGLTNRFGHKRP